jgi:hypothetical protein
MVIKRPDMQSKGAEPDLEIMEQLVKKSLEINPQLKDGKNTRQVLADLRNQALARSKSGSGGGGPSSMGGGQSTMGQARSVGSAPAATAAKPDMAARRKNTISFFFEQKASEFEESVVDINMREKALQKEKNELQQRFFDELVDFFTLMAGGAQSPESRAVLVEQRAFLSQLGVAEADLIREVQRRGNK